MGTVQGGAGATRTNRLHGCCGCLSSESASNARNNDDYTYTYTWLYILIYYTVAIKNWRSASKCDEKQKQTNNRQQRQATETLTLTRLSLAQGTQPFDLLRTLRLPNLANHLEETINGPLIASLCLGSTVEPAALADADADKHDWVVATNPATLPSTHRPSPLFACHGNYAKAAGKIF